MNTQIYDVYRDERGGAVSTFAAVQLCSPMLYRFWFHKLKSIVAFYNGNANYGQLFVLSITAATTQ